MRHRHREYRNHRMSAGRQGVGSCAPEAEPRTAGPWQGEVMMAGNKLEKDRVSEERQGPLSDRCCQALLITADRPIRATGMNHLLLGADGGSAPLVPDVG
jgi:hypothetical protein